MNKEFHIKINDRIGAVDKIVNILSEHCDLSKKQVKQAMKKGAFWLEDSKGIRRLRRADTVPTQGSTLHFYYAPDVLAIVPPAPILIADEADYSIWSKPAGMLSQGSKWGDHCTINRWIEINEPFDVQPQRNCFVVHRLDKAACGLMIIAHKKSAAAKLSALFEKRELSKCYRVIVHGIFKDEELVMDSEIDGKDAYSSAKLIAYDDIKNHSLLHVYIKTGRKHQIRIHLSRSGYPVIGDYLYSNNAERYEHLMLSAFSLDFICPISGKRQKYKLPEDMQLRLQ